MLRVTIILVVQMLILLGATSVSASSMRCKLNQVLTVTQSGKLEPNPLESAYLGNDLVVDMNSGVVYHAGFGNETYPTKAILDRGSMSSSFKLLSSSVPGQASDNDHPIFVNTVYLQIDTWIDGSQKPFLVIESNNIGYGVCQ